MSGPRMLTKALDFCRAGYPPPGVPPRGFITLLALYGRRDTGRPVSSPAPTPPPG
ncbi:MULTISPECIES: hypothetical protein [Mycolicibacterium]|uniref:hypothetical protein n=1 Tax=Mycolicibacterium TaxID=1866885 RepID=UPI0002DB4DE6|nr:MULTISPECIES: hypothetical protein [Mycolicibacterium]MCV7130838.1 hypothetical protein [Mycolicibacterium vanbaalenii PYR-1]MDW5611553.1 hypothetical protein [Mycolicibacterium sp. D5.8-2]QZT57817.1 DUF3349 domain-containing protein [Mycolicibacterium austroafricanum]QZY47155.1 DUF3349 domain-containing protein [Mycolicibacterium austroafricanum]